MESKTKHRILGMIVVAGIAVIAYPFIQGSGGLSNEQVTVNAPPFPDQAIQVTADNAAILETPESSMPPTLTDTSPSVPDVTSTDVPSINAATIDQSNVVNIAAPANNDAPSGEAAPLEAAPETSDEAPAPATTMPPAEAETPAQPTQEAPNTPVTPDVINQSATPSSLNNTNTVTKKPKTKLTAKTKSTARKTEPVVLSKLTSASAIHANQKKPIQNDGLLQLKKAAWVVQIGSFKQKKNALNLVNKLRAQGYRAFIQRAVLAKGENTRVFVGPELHQASARIVAAELEKKMKLHAIVISYKPFTL